LEVARLAEWNVLIKESSDNFSPRLLVVISHPTVQVAYAIVRQQDTFCMRSTFRISIGN